jgi:hypothetical protein
VILGESLSARQWLGAALILTGMLVSELAPRRERGEETRPEPVRDAATGVRGPP